MRKYWVEGTYVSQRTLKRDKKRAARADPTDVEPFSMAFWANSPEEALRMAQEKLDKGVWVEGPTIVKQSEEDRMRTMGAPELPGFTPLKNKHKT